MGTFISSDYPLIAGSRFGMDLTIPVDYESSKIFRMQGTVTWNKIQPFKSKTNGMGVKFIDPLPEDLLLYALAHNFRKLQITTPIGKFLGFSILSNDRNIERSAQCQTYYIRKGFPFGSGSQLVNKAYF